MSPERKTEAVAKAPPQLSSPAPHSRKAWKPRSPVEVVLDQIQKQEKKVADLDQALSREKASLNKLLQAKKVLEA